MASQVIARLLVYSKYSEEANGFIRTRTAPGRPKPIGARVGHIDRDGYRCVRICGIQFFEHQLVWLYHNNAYPKYGIDHIDGNKLNNSISNLRDVPMPINRRNSVMQINNTSGYTGVSWYEAKNKWVARTWINRKQIYHGIFSTKEEAIAARNSFISTHPELGFTQRHGK